MVAPALTIEKFMLEQPERLWEVHRGALREKPSMSESHNIVIWWLNAQLVPQLDVSRYELRINLGRVRFTEATYYVPDVYIVPIRDNRSIRNRSYRLEVFDEPLPFVAEGWSPSTGDYDVDEKIPEYRRRGDAEIWRLHPFDFTLTAWRRQSDGTYVETMYQTGTISLLQLPNVTIDLDALFA